MEFAIIVDAQKVGCLADNDHENRLRRATLAATMLGFTVLGSHDDRYHNDLHGPYILWVHEWIDYSNSDKEIFDFLSNHLRKHRGRT